MNKLQRQTRINTLVQYVLKRDVLLSVLVVLCVVIAGVFLGHQNNGVVPLSTDQTSHYQAETANPLHFMANWDAPDYIRISQHGYQVLDQTNFFPLYPLLIHAVNLVIPSALDS